MSQVSTPMARVKKILLFLCIVLAPIQDCGLQGTWLKGLGATPAFFPLLLLVGIGSLERLWRVDFVLSKTMLWALSYICFLTAVYYFISNVPQGTNLFAKTCAFAVLALVMGSLIWIVDYRDEQLVRKAISISFFVTVLGVLGGDFNFLQLGSLLANPAFHYTAITDLRPRGLCSESSTLSVQLAATGFLAIHYARSMWAQLAFAILTLLLLLVSGSKGAVFVLALCFVSVVMIKRWSLPMRLGLSLFILPVLYLAAIYLSSHVTEPDLLLEYTTACTRVTMALWAFITVFHNPLGVGFSGFLGALTKYLPTAINITRNLSPLPLNFSEVYAYTNSTENVGTKTLLLDYVTFFGVPFFVAFIIFNLRIIRLLRQNSSLALLVAVMFVSLAISTYAGLPSMYEVPLVYGIALNEIRKYYSLGSSTRFPVSSSPRRISRHLAADHSSPSPRV